MSARTESSEALRDLLQRLDGRSYKAFKDLTGRRFDVGGAELFVDHVQGDPFAAPSRMRLRVAMAQAELPPDLHDTRPRRIALEDFLARAVRRTIREVVRGRRGSGKSGRVGIDAGGQEILERTAVRVTPTWVEARIEVGLPAAGRRPLGREAEAMLLDELPRLAERALCMPPQDERQARRHVDTADDHAALCMQLAAHGLVAFVADGSILPRESGASDRPPRSGAVAFESPPNLRVTLELAHPHTRADGATTTEIEGLGIPEGVTLIVGGGYHGKSTLLRAVERGVHPHVPGDGRERIATRPSATKIRAEDGRRVEGCDIAGFISDLPAGLGRTRSTRSFSSDDASGSTSQAAAIVEALEAGSCALLLDEDTSATNFMVRDARMQALVHPDREPITPFVERVRSLADDLGVSSVIVMGASGDYFAAADTVIELHDYVPRDVTAEAKRIAAQSEARPSRADGEALTRPRARTPDPDSIDPSARRRDARIDARGTDGLRLGENDVDLRGLEQLVDPSQTRAIGWLLARGRAWMQDAPTMARWLDRVEAFLDEDGLDALCDRPTDLARPRRHEVAASLNRLRTFRVSQDT